MLKRGCFPAPHQLSLNDMIIERVDDYCGDRQPLTGGYPREAHDTTMIDARYVFIEYFVNGRHIVSGRCARPRENTENRPPFDVNEPFRGERVLYKSSWLGFPHHSACYRKRERKV